MNAPRPGRVQEQDSVVTGPGGPVPVRDYRPPAGSGRPFLWVHGGGFVSGGIDQAESYAPARELAARGRWVRTVDYRLAPRYPLWRAPDLSPRPGRFPAGLDDVSAVAISLSALAGGPIDLGGASAGANLAAAAALRLRDGGHSVVARLALAYGTFHHELPEASPVFLQLRGPLAKWAFNPTMTRSMNLNYVGDDALLGPGYAFPGGSDLRGLPPTLIMDASNDRLRASGALFAQELRESRVQVRQLTVKGLHGFLSIPRTRSFRQGVDELHSWLERGRR